MAAMRTIYAFYDMYHLDDDVLRACVCDHKDFNPALDECASVLYLEDYEVIENSSEA